MAPTQGYNASKGAVRLLTKSASCTSTITLYNIGLTM